MDIRFYRKHDLVALVMVVAIFIVAAAISYLRKAKPGSGPGTGIFGDSVALNPGWEFMHYDTAVAGDDPELHVLGRANWQLVGFKIDSSGQSHYLFQRPHLEDIKIISAIFGADQGTADVTALVSKLVKPGLNEFFVSPNWLKVDPCHGWNKFMKITYDYGGKRSVFTSEEGAAVSYAILAENASSGSVKTPGWEYKRIDATNVNDPGVEHLPADGWKLAATAVDPRQSLKNVILERPRTLAAHGPLKIISAYYGIGDEYADVTDVVASQILPGLSPLISSNATLKTDTLTKKIVHMAGPAVPAAITAEVNRHDGMNMEFMITYEYDGVRENYLTADHQPYSYDLLAANALRGGSGPGMVFNYSYANKTTQFFSAKP